MKTKIHANIGIEIESHKLIDRYFSNIHPFRPFFGLFASDSVSLNADSKVTENTGYSIGGFDADKIEGGLTLGVGEAGESLFFLHDNSDDRAFARFRFEKEDFSMMIHFHNALHKRQAQPPTSFFGRKARCKYFTLA